MKWSRQIQTNFMAALALAGCSSSAFADAIYLSKVAEYQAPHRIRSAVREECRIHERLPELVRQRILESTEFKDVSLVDDPLIHKEGYAVIISIAALDVSSSGWSTQPSFMRTKATLYRHGAAAGEFIKSERRDTAFGNPFSGFRGSCGIAKNMATDIVKELVIWLRGRVVQINSSAPHSVSNG